ncbi:MAG: wax ester/triacylglycerol synthase family O-acyltransferase [Solirubrobacteraceae bacterium]|nr:wax ester/triacylglycerol synthase family O-acyltransferase [Solirubrobacteraceae bacterium]
MTPAPTSIASVRRLSALDGSFLRLETRQSHMHVGFSAVFAAPDEERRRPTIEALRERAAGRAHEVPWCRWKLDEAPLGLSEPRWIDDADFDLGAHFVALTDPSDPVSEQSFEALRCAVLSTPLDRSRPLWQVFLVPRLHDGRVGMVGKIHHALVDGISALQIVRLFADQVPDAESQPPVRWHPQGRAGPLGWAVDAARGAVGDGVGALRAGSDALAHPRSSANAAARGARLLATAIAEDILPAAPSSQLNGRIGTRRTLVGYHAPRALLRAARGRGGTLNDVGMTAVAGALRMLALRDGEPPADPLKTMIPVSLRRHGDDGAGNQIAMVYTPLPVHLATCGERLDFVREQTARLKHTDRPEATAAFVQTAGGLVPPPLRTPVVRAMAGPRQFNLTVSQSPAPRGSMYLLGCELDEVYSVVPIPQGHALAIGMVRYRQELFFGCYADPDALPEVHELPALLEAELEALAAAAAGRRAAGTAAAAVSAGSPARPPRATDAPPDRAANGRAPLTPVG